MVSGLRLNLMILLSIIHMMIISQPLVSFIVLSMYSLKSFEVIYYYLWSHLLPICIAILFSSILCQFTVFLVAFRSFFIAAPVVWNSLPLYLRSPSISRSQFQAGLKTHLFRLAFHWLILCELLIEPMELNWTELCSLCTCILCFQFPELQVQKKKHPLTFSFISPWIICGFKQKLQWIYSKIGGFWKCKN